MILSRRGRKLGNHELATQHIWKQNKERTKHMKNVIPKKIPALLTLAGDAADGAGTHGATIPLLQNTEVNINADIVPLNAALLAYGQATGLLKAKRAVLHDKTKAGRTFITLTRDNLKPLLGNEYNANWDATGMIGSLGVRATDGEVLPLLKTFHDYLVANPALEVDAKDITAVKADDLFTDLKAARTAVNEQETVTNLALALRNSKASLLRKRLRGLISELSQKMGPLDERWLSFGLNKPGAVETPEQVANLVAVLIGPGVVATKWDAAARAKYYHVFKKVVGVDDQYVLVGSPADIDFNLEGLPAGQTVDIVVAAVNNGGEGVQSNKVTLTTHP
jgi:hypothetical protein